MGYDYSSIKNKRLDEFEPNQILPFFVFFTSIDQYWLVPRTESSIIYIIRINCLTIERNVMVST